ncbi:MAG: glycosyltransferase family 1 protein [Alphaproteobacteria bacterium]|nr:glycosyltransferase family 1 protein [Alphaproteobacteria bacterium]
MSKKILIVSDAWPPLINGVVRTLQATQRELQKMGHDVEVIGPDFTSWRSVKLPLYPEIKQELFAGNRIGKVIDRFGPHYVHIATEGFLGLAARRQCMRRGIPFTTAFHTNLHDYISVRAPHGTRHTVRHIVYRAMRRFHAPSSAIMVATPSIEKELRDAHFHRIVRWSRGVDTEMFSPDKRDAKYYDGLPRPISLYVGRIAVEKNLRTFLDLKTPGSKVLVGDGPDLGMLRQEYPDACFPGYKEGENLARAFASADMFVFPSKTDTFGLVMIEACASGLRVAALPVRGPIDIFASPSTRDIAVLDNNLQQAVNQALQLPQDPGLPRRFAEQYTWRACTEQFLQHLQAPTPIAKRRLGRFSKKMPII